MVARFVNYDFDKNVGLSNFLNKSPEVWFENKKKADNTEGLWRIHDGLYDVSDFVKKHPGGKFWLEETKGMDVTEFFESHHVRSDRPEKMLKDFYVRKANGPRQSKYTFFDDGFYRTLKRKVRNVLKTIPKEREAESKFWTDVLISATIVFACLSNYFSMYSLAVLGGLFSTFSFNATHNFIHQKDNWRMFYADVVLLPSRGARIVHVLSHHMYTNTVADMQYNFGRPMLDQLPVPKSFTKKYLSWIYTPLIIWPLLFYMIQLTSTLGSLSTKKRRGKEALLTFVIPLAMLIFGQQSITATLWMWQVIILSHGFFFGLIGLALNHTHPDIYADGDLTRSKDKWDWGINQLDTSQEKDLHNTSKLIILISFGDHGLHHLFPTLDHSILEDLYPVVEETLKEFNFNSIRMSSFTESLIGYFQRMTIDTPNMDPERLGYTRRFTRN